MANSDNATPWATREGPRVPKRPEPGDPPFHRSPFAPTFEQRRTAYFEWLLEQPTPGDKRGVWTSVGKLDAGESAIDEMSFEDAIKFVNERRDPSDFYLTALIRMYFLHRDSEKLPAARAESIRKALLGYKYRLDEPNVSWLEMWTENHQILTAAAEYLAGQLFPDEVFSNNGETGRQRREQGRRRVLRWIRRRAQTGFAEWDSSWYYPDDLAALLNLADFAADDEVARQASMLIDLILFDVAVDSYYGFHATSHGRVTTPGIKSAAGNSLTTLQAVAWGLGRFESAENMGVISLATARRYRLPAVLEAVAQDAPERYLNRERHSIPLDEAAAERYGLSFQSLDDIFEWWGMGAFTRPGVIGTTARAAKEWDLWHYDAFKPLENGALLRRLKLLGLFSRLLGPDANGMLLSEANKITWRTPDGQLSSVQDFRKGEKGYQQHVWQATLDPYAVVFTSNPDSLAVDDSERPGYWFGNGRLPRTAQHENVLIALYKISRRKSALESRHYKFTHAYFPRWAFDEIREEPASPGGWIFGRKGDGYVALYSREPYVWVAEGADADQEIVAEGRKNVWICHLGRAATDGDFQQFAEKIRGAPLEVRGLRVRYEAPGMGELRFDWNGPLIVDGREVALNGYPRWDNPYAQAAFGDLRFQIAHAGRSLTLDFEHSLREIGGDASD